MRIDDWLKPSTADTEAVTHAKKLLLHSRENGCELKENLYCVYDGRNFKCVAVNYFGCLRLHSIKDDAFTMYVGVNDCTNWRTDV